MGVNSAERVPMSKRARPACGFPSFEAIAVADARMDHRGSMPRRLRKRRNNWGVRPISGTSTSPCFPSDNTCSVC